MHCIIYFYSCHFFVPKKGTFKPDEPVVTVEAQVIQDVVYGGRQTTKKWMFFCQGNRSVSSTKVFVFVHGGAWGEG